MVKRRLLGIAVATLLASQAWATQLTIVPLTGAEQSTEIDRIGTWQFKGDTAMVLYAKADGTELATRKLAEIRKIVFTENKTNVDEATPASAYSVYPNPTQDELFVRGADEQTALQVIDMQGRVVRSAKGASISVGNLPNGVYTLLVDGEAFRVVKK